MIRKTTIVSFHILLCIAPIVHSQGFDVFEKSIPELQAAMESGETTSNDLVQQYLDRIEAFDRGGAMINSMIYVNPQALAEADVLDRERAAGGTRGPLHGIPVVLKDNYDTFDMPTTASLMALKGHIPPDDSYQVRKLREAGAVFIGKSNMHELAMGITSISSLGGQTLNPYDPRRNPGGSSGGTGAAVAAGLAAVGMGSDTCGSIRIPAANNNLFGIRVTQGLSSRDGIIPLSHTQDVGGPLARSMIDLALILDETVGYDPNDPQTAVAEGKGPASFAALADQGTLDGLRLGLLKSHLSDKTPFDVMTKVVMSAVSKMTEQGAETVELEIEGLEEMVDGFGVIGMELSADMEAYFKASNAPVKTLADVLESGLYHAVQEPRYRDPIRGDATLEDYPERFAARATLAAAINEAMDEHNVDVLVYPTLRVKPRRLEEGQFGSSCQMSAQSGHPAISMPAGFTPDGVPVGIELLAKPFEDDKLVAIAFAYEKIAMPRKAPSRTPSLVSDTLFADFSVQSQQISGDLRLDKATQTLYYELELQGLDIEDIRTVALHRGEEYTNGPVLDLLGSALNGSVAIRNADLANLLDEGLYIAVYSHDGREASGRGQVLHKTQ